MSLKARKARPLTDGNERFSYRTSSIRTGGEHVIRVIKRKFVYMKVRYMGIATNAAQPFPLIDLTNLYLAKRAFMSWWAESAQYTQKKAQGRKSLENHR